MQITIDSHETKEILDITELINEHIQKEDLNNGLCTIFVKHTTACITTADLDPGTDQDMLDAFDAMMPKLRYRHPHNPSHVTDHILSSLIGPSITIPFIHGQLDLGVWQRIVLVELDGPRRRNLTISFVKS